MIKSTSFRLPDTIISLLKRLAHDDNRSITNMMEKLITDRAKTEGLISDGRDKPDYSKETPENVRKVLCL